MEHSGRNLSANAKLVWQQMHPTSWSESSDEMPFPPDFHLLTKEESDWFFESIARKDEFGSYDALFLLLLNKTEAPSALRAQQELIWKKNSDHYFQKCAAVGMILYGHTKDPSDFLRLLLFIFKSPEKSFHAGWRRVSEQCLLRTSFSSAQVTALVKLKSRFSQEGMNENGFSFSRGPEEDFPLEFGLENLINRLFLDASLVFKDDDRQMLYRLDAGKSTLEFKSMRTGRQDVVNDLDVWLRTLTQLPVVDSDVFDLEYPASLLMKLGSAIGLVRE